MPIATSANAPRNTVAGIGSHLTDIDSLDEDHIHKEPAFKTLHCSDPAEAVLRNLKGEAVASLSKGALNKPQCGSIYHEFLNAKEVTVRNDGVGGRILGSSHYGIAPSEYVERCLATSTAVHRVLGGPTNIIMNLLERIATKAADEGITAVRPLIHNGLPAASGRLMLWETIPGNETLVLEHHDDAAQISAKINAGSEFHAINPNEVSAIVGYLHVESPLGNGVDESLGALHIFDFVPTPEDRAALGVGERGFPYPPSCVEGRDRLILPVATGDLAVIRGAYVHAVYSGPRATKDRLVVNLFMARVGSTLIYWT